MPPDRRTLLAMGGSQGARSINDALASLVRDRALPEGWQLIHVTGEREYDRVRSITGGAVRAGRAPVPRRPRRCLCRFGPRFGPIRCLHDRRTRGGGEAIGPRSLSARRRRPSTRQRRGDRGEGAAVVVNDGELAAGRLGEILHDATRPERLTADDGGGAAVCNNPIRLRLFSPGLTRCEHEGRQRHETREPGISSESAASA